MSTLSDLLKFLYQHNGAISGISTVVLVLVTAWYVWLTRRLVAIGQGQLAQSLRNEVEAREREKELRGQAIMGLFRVAHRLRATLIDLPHDRQQAERMRAVTMWPVGDEDDLEALALKVGHEFFLMTVSAVPALRSIRRKVCEVQAINPLTGFDWNHFRFEDWFRELDTAEQSLRAILDRLPAADRN